MSTASTTQSKRRVLTTFRFSSRPMAAAHPSEKSVPRAQAEGRNSRRRIDRASPVPYYYQLQELLKQEIESGRWQAGDLLPSEAELAVDLGISRTVIRKALDVLEGDGQVYRVKGKGTVVARPKFRYEAVAAASGWDAEPPSEKPALERVIHGRAVPAGTRLGRLLDVAVAADVYELVCVHS